MEVIKTNFPDVFLLKPKIWGDDRGYYVETYKQQLFNDLLGETNFIQDNESKSIKGVMRGLHFQEPPFTQAKLIRTITGAIIDVIVDIRTDSNTFGEMEIIKLNDVTKEQLFIPKGFAHGFVAVEDNTIIEYKVDNRYAPPFESGILFGSMPVDFRDLIGHEEFTVSDKDQNLKPFKDVMFFTSDEYQITK